jgi:hypothetical protein
MMPDRLIRDELLNSERYWSVSDEAKLLYIHLILSADDTARYSGKNFTLRTRCFSGRGMETNRMEILLSELVDQDLIRLYFVEDERFIFIPRFKQRLRYYNSKYPEPPIQINDINYKKTDLSLTQVIPKTDSSLLKRSEVKRREENINTYTDDFELFWKLYSKPVGKVNAFKEWNKLKPNAELIKLITEKAKAQVIAIPETKFRKDAERWIRDRRWEDEITAKPTNDIFSPQRTTQ